MSSALQIRGIEKLSTQLTAAARAKIRFASMKALANTADGAREASKKEISDVFTGPVKTIVNSVKVKMEGMRATVYIEGEPYSYKNIFKSPANVLRPHIFGGERIAKNSERTLRRLGVLRENQVVTPSKFVTLDGNGNVPAQTMLKIMSAAGLLDPLAGKNQNQTARSRSRNKSAMRGVYCIPFVGIFQHTASQGAGNRRWASNHGGPSVPLIFFSSKPEYEAGRFDFYYVVSNYFKKNFLNNFQRYWKR